MVRVGVILSGSGVFDGSEIHESVLTILALDRAGAEAVFFAPNKNQSEVINHLTGQVAPESRNVLVESARIARGQIRDIREARAADLDAVILPGGFGVVKNLSDFCWNGERCWVDGEVYRLLGEMLAAKKPIGAACIAPAILAKIFSAEKPRLTIGSDEGTAKSLKQLGAQHVKSQAVDIVVDERLNIVTTPAYMLARRISEVSEGIERMVEAVVRRAKRRQADSATSLISRNRKRQPADSATARVVSRANASRATRVSTRKTQSSARRRAVRA